MAANDLCGHESRYEVLRMLGFADDFVALIRDAHESSATMTRLYWTSGRSLSTEHVASPERSSRHDPHNVPVRRSGTDLQIGQERLSLDEAIDKYAPLVLEHWAFGAEVMSLDEPGNGGAGGHLRDPGDFTLDEAPEQAAAAEVLRASMDGLFSLPERGTLLGPARRFYEEIVSTAGRYPRIATDLLYEAQRELHGWPV